MRDIDLFVGVASIGNDPTWYDGAHQYDEARRDRHCDYWHSYSFGELSTTAETRKHLLSSLIPRLIIAERCQIEDRYLKVRGDLRTIRFTWDLATFSWSQTTNISASSPIRARTALRWNALLAF